MMKSSRGRRWALVTGASSGIGQGFAERLARDGYNVVLVARRRDRLEALAQQLEREHDIETALMAADLTDSAELRQVEAHIAETPALSMLVNNAGYGGYMPFAELPADRAENLIRLQTLAVTRLTRAALPGMVARRDGAIINVSSRLAFSATLPTPPLPQRAVYAATKAYINVFTQLLAGELEGSDVRVQALCPGVIRTEFHQTMGMDPDRFPEQQLMSVETLVDTSLAGLALGEIICIPALQNPSRLAELGAQERTLLQESNHAEAAPRYRN